MWRNSLICGVSPRAGFKGVDMEGHPGMGVRLTRVGRLSTQRGFLAWGAGTRPRREHTCREEGKKSDGRFVYMSQS